MTQVEDLGLEYAIRMRQEARDSRDTVPLSNLLRLPREVGLGNPLWIGRQKVEGNGILLVAPVAHQSTVKFTMEQNDPASDLCVVTDVDTQVPGHVTLTLDNESRMQQEAGEHVTQAC